MKKIIVLLSAASMFMGLVSCDKDDKDAIDPKSVPVYVQMDFKYRVTQQEVADYDITVTSYDGTDRNDVTVREQDWQTSDEYLEYGQTVMAELPAEFAFSISFKEKGNPESQVRNQPLRYSYSYRLLNEDKKDLDNTGTGEGMLFSSNFVSYSFNKKGIIKL